MINRCVKCKAYTIKEIHCEEKTISCHPQKFSIEKERKYGKYRRAVKAKL